MSSLDAFYAGGPRTPKEAFPPACLRTHWDPTMVVKHVLPSCLVALNTYDPRPSAKICTSYHVSSAGDAPLPPSPPSTVPSTPPQFLGGMHRPSGDPGHVFPPGGAPQIGFPYASYNSIAESDLLRVNEKLSKCAERRYIPTNGIPAENASTNVVPGAPGIEPPSVLLGPKAGCREADDVEAWARSSRLFFNPTRYDRTNTMPRNLYKPDSQGAAKYPL